MLLADFNGNQILLEDVLYIPSFRRNLLSVGKLTQNNINLSIIDGRLALHKKWHKTKQRHRRRKIRRSKHIHFISGHQLPKPSGIALHYERVTTKDDQHFQEDCYSQYSQDKRDQEPTNEFPTHRKKDLPETIDINTAHKINSQALLRRTLTKLNIALHFGSRSCGDSKDLLYATKLNYNQKWP